MELDRHQIERKDFPAARRGYDPDEVDRHLSEIADEVARLKQSGRESPSVAGAAAEQVRTIIEAAERSAGAIEEKAEAEAARITDDAARVGRDTRDKADAEATDYVQSVQQATRRMLERAGSIETELDSLLEGVRTETGTLVDNLRGGAGALESDLERIRAGLTDVRDARPGHSVLDEGPAEPDQVDLPGPPEPVVADAGYGVAEEDVAPDGAEPVEPEAAFPDDISITVEEEEEDEDDYEVLTATEPELAPEAELEPEPEAEAEAEAEPEPAPARSSSSGSEGARLIALNMALNGTPRDETAQYLSDNFDLEDQDRILDEVYARVG